MGLAVILPLWVVLRIIFDRGRTTASILWTESILAGAWLAIGLHLLLIDWTGGPISLLIAGAVGAVIAGMPYAVGSFQSSSGRTGT